MNTTGVFSSATDKWETPQDLYDRLNEIFCFNLDAAADEANHKCDHYFTEKEDGLSQSWGGGIECGVIRRMGDLLADG